MECADIQRQLDIATRKSMVGIKYEGKPILFTCPDCGDLFYYGETTLQKRKYKYPKRSKKADCMKYFRVCRPCAKKYKDEQRRLS